MFSTDLGDGVALALRDLSTVGAVHALIVKNVDRLRAWEHWAHEEQSEQSLQQFTRTELLEWVDGRRVPCVIQVGGTIAGTISARIDPYVGVAQLGYWIDEDYEGRGIVTRAAGGLVDALFDDPRIARVEIRAGALNMRSRAVAERIGFAHEGTLRSAIRVGPERQDVAMYGRLRL